MLPSSPMAPFTPAVLAQLPEPAAEPRNDTPVGTDPNPLAPMAPVAVGPQGKCCGDVDGGGGPLTVNDLVFVTGAASRFPTSGTGVNIEPTGSIYGYNYTANTYSDLEIQGNPLLMRVGVFNGSRISMEVGQVRIFGNTGIGPPNFFPSFTLDVNGDINLTGRILINGVQVLP